MRRQPDPLRSTPFPFSASAPPPFWARPLLPSSRMATPAPRGTDSATYQVHHLRGSQVGSLPSKPAMRDNSRLLSTPGSCHLLFISTPHLPPSLLCQLHILQGLNTTASEKASLITHTAAPCSCPPSAHSLLTSLILMCMFDKGTQFIHISPSSHGAEGV